MPGGPALAAPVPPSVDWPTAGFDAARTGGNPRESMVTTATVRNLRESWARDLDGSATTAQPIVVANVDTTTGRRDLAIVATEHGDTHALDAATGAQSWTHNSP